MTQDDCRPSSVFARKGKISFILKMSKMNAKKQLSVKLPNGQGKSDSWLRAKQKDLLRN